MARFPTNTLIITEASDALLKDSSELMSYIAQAGKNCEVIVLQRFGRLLVICEDSATSKEILSYLKNSEQWNKLKITFSLQDNIICTGYTVEEEMDYLELPSEDGSKRFLISPPLSPPPEWDHWDKVEDMPHPNPVYKPEELSNLLWERLGGHDSNQVRKYDTDIKRDLSIEPQVLFEGVDEGVPVIMLDSVDGSIMEAGASKTVVKTSLPPLN